MLHKSLRSFSVLQSLKSLQSESEAKSSSGYSSFMSSYSSFCTSNRPDIHCYSTKLTPSQTERVERLSDQIISLTAIQSRIFMYLMQEALTKSFHYRPQYKESVNTGETLYTDSVWPSVHPANIEFQKETQDFGLIGIHGVPNDFIEKVKSGEAISKIEAINKANS